MYNKLEEFLIFHPELEKYCKMNKLSKRQKTVGIVIHHTASEGSTPESVTLYHTQKKGWSHAGYNILITPDGLAHSLRPLECMGAHCGVGAAVGQPGYWNNRATIGISFTGNMMNHAPNTEQIAAFTKLLPLLMKEYPELTTDQAYILGHKNMPKCATLCSGTYMPMDSFTTLFTAAQQQIDEELNPVDPEQPVVIPEIWATVAAPCYSLKEAKAIQAQAQSMGYSVEIEKRTIYIPVLITNKSPEKAAANLITANQAGFEAAYIMPINRAKQTKI